MNRREQLIRLRDRLLDKLLGLAKHMTNPIEDPDFEPLKRALVDAMVRSGVAGSAGDMTHPCQAREVAEVIVREVHRLVSVYRDYAAECLEAREQQTERWVQAAAERDAAESSRRDWAAEAMYQIGLRPVSKSLDWLLAFGPGHLGFPRLCACISDDQATQLGPGFTRPVCAVHPKESA